MTTPIGTTFGTTGPAPSGGQPQGQASAIETLAKQLGISPEMLKELLKAELAEKGHAGSQKGCNPSGQAGDKTPNPSGEAGDLNGDGVVDEKDLELLAKQKLDVRQNQPNQGAIDSGANPPGMPGSPSFSSGAIV